MPDMERIEQIVSYKTEDGMIFESRDKAEEHDRELFLKNRLFKLLYNEFDTSPIDLDHMRDWMIRDAKTIINVLKDYVE